MSGNDGNDQCSNALLYTAVAGVVGLYALNKLTQPKRVSTAKLVEINNETMIQVDKNDPPFMTEPQDEMKIRKCEKGVGSIEAETVFSLLRRAVKTLPDGEALRLEKRGGTPGTWDVWTWQKYYDDIMCASRAFIALGLPQFSCVNIIGFNSPEWIIADLAAIACGAKAAGIYTTNNPQACKYISEHSEAHIAVVENEAQLDKFLTIRDQLKDLKAIIMYTGAIPNNANVEGKCKVYLWNEFMELGNKDDKKELQEEVEKRIAAQRPGQCCTLIYTSGTTGNPKAVMLSHDNCVWTSKSTLRFLPLSPDDRSPQQMISYLPLSHIAAQMLDIYAPMVLVAERKQPCTIWFARPDALKGSLLQTITAAKPTMFFGVPRVFEKIEEKMRETIKKTQGIKKTIFEFATSQGIAAGHAAQLGGSGVYPRLYSLADRLVFKKVRKQLGFENTWGLYTGAAPISKDTLWFFESLGLPIYELFGMSEVTGPHSISLPNYRKIGSCGAILEGCDVKVDHVNGRDKEGEGELCLRGRNVMMGYMKDKQKTRECIDDEGYMHSGDVGKVEKGLVYITGRIKELLITAGGENIAPIPVEDCLRKEMPAISSAMMVGDRRKFNTVLLTLRTAVDEKTGGFTDELVGPAKHVSSDSKTVTEAKKDPKWQKYIEDGIKRTNKQAVSNAQTVQKYAILPQDFSVATGELTATLKLKRQFVTTKYSDIIEEMYQ